MNKDIHALFEQLRVTPFPELGKVVGDFALLIQSGFSKRAAMMAQFGTALGALLGTCIGIAIQELSARAGSGGAAGGAGGAVR